MLVSRVLLIAQVCPRDLAERLVEAGLRRPAGLSWYQNLLDDWLVAETGDLRRNNMPAWSVAELGEMLPAYSFSRRWDFLWRAHYYGTVPALAYPGYVALGGTEAGARASLLLLLIEAKVVTVEALNEVFP